MKSFNVGPARAALLLALVTTLSACGGGKTEPDEPAARDAAMQRAIQAPLDKARAVDELQKQDQQRKRDAIEREGG